MEPEEGPPEAQDQKNGLRRLVWDALDSVVRTAPDLSTSALEGAVNAITDGIGGLARSPTMDQVADIVKEGLQASGEGLGQAAEEAGEVAAAILEGLGDISG